MKNFPSSLPRDVQEEVIVHCAIFGTPSLVVDAIEEGVVGFSQERNLWISPRGLYRVLSEEDHFEIINNLRDLFYALYSVDVRRVTIEMNFYYVIRVSENPIFLDSNKTLYFDNAAPVLHLITIE